MSLHSLAPWEIPPDSNIPICAPAYTRVLIPLEDTYRMLSVRVDYLPNNRNMIFIRQLGTEAGNWILWASKGQPFSNIPIPPRIGFNLISVRDFSRFYVWPEQQDSPIRGLLIGIQTDTWNSAWLDKDLNCLGNFICRTANRQNMLHWSAKEMLEAVKREMEDEASDIYFAHKWASSSEEQKRKILGYGTPQVEEAIKVMRWVMQSTDWIWEESSHWKWHVRKPYFPIRNYYYYELSFYNMERYSESMKSPKANSLRRWNEYFYNSFSHLFKQGIELSEQHHCISGGVSYSPTQFKVEISEKPSYHERLEAKIKLKNWAKLNLSQQEIELLLSDGV